MNATKCVLFACLSLLAAAASADSAYRCKDASGRTFYSRDYCPGGDRVRTTKPHDNPEAYPAHEEQLRQLENRYRNHEIGRREYNARKKRILRDR